MSTTAPNVTAAAGSPRHEPWRLFRLRGAGPPAWWVIAPDQTSAIEWSVDAGKLANAEGVTAIKDQTEDWLGCGSHWDLAEVLATAPAIGQGRLRLRHRSGEPRIGHWVVNPRG